MGVSKRRRTSALEELGVVRSPTRLWTVVVVPATQLIRTESLTTTLASHHRTVTWWRPELQSLRARGQKVGSATDHWAKPLALVRCHRHSEVEAVNEANGVGREVLVAMMEANLNERRRSFSSGTVALYSATAVAGGAGEVVVRICAAGSGPDPTRPVVVRGGEGAVGESV